MYFYQYLINIVYQVLFSCTPEVHWGLNKKAAMLQMTFLKPNSWKKKKKTLHLFTETSLKFAPKGPIEH